MYFKKNKVFKKILVVILFLGLLNVFFVSSPKTVKAVPTEETFSIPSALRQAWEQITKKLEDAWEKQGSVVYNKVLRTALNRSP